MSQDVRKEKNSRRKVKGKLLGSSIYLVRYRIVYSNNIICMKCKHQAPISLLHFLRLPFFFAFQTVHVVIGKCVSRGAVVSRQNTFPRQKLDRIKSTQSHRVVVFTVVSNHFCQRRRRNFLLYRYVYWLLATSRGFKKRTFFF